MTTPLPQTTVDPAVAYLVQSDDEGRGGWGSWIKVTVAPTPEADAAAAAFFARATKYTVGAPYNVCHVDEETTGPLGDKLMDFFYPTCEHGLSADLCAGPQHYPYDDAERQRYGY